MEGFFMPASLRQKFSPVQGCGVGDTASQITAQNLSLPHEPFASFASSTLIQMENG
jgi:hypothetical protein